MLLKTSGSPHPPGKDEIKPGGYFQVQRVLPKPNELEGAVSSCRAQILPSVDGICKV